MGTVHGRLLTGGMSRGASMFVGQRTRDGPNYMLLNSDAVVVVFPYLHGECLAGVLL